MRTGILIVILWLQASFCLSQNFGLAGSRLKFEDLPEGLSQNSVNCIVQDKKGFIWLGTQDGLNRFDGYGFKVYKHDPLVEGSLGSSSLWALFEDSRGNLWAGAERGGLNLYDQANDRFTQFDYEIKEDTYLSNSVVYDILEVESGILWLATSNGLVLFDVASTTFSPPPGPVNLKQTVIWVLYQDRNNNLWIGTDGSGLWKHDLTTKEFSHYRAEPNNTRSITHNSIRSVFQDRKGRLWIGTEGGGLNQFHQDGKYFTAIRYDPKNPNSLTDDDVWAILDDDHNNLIIGTDGGGLNILTNQEKMIHILPDDVNPKSINDNVIRDLYRDKQGNLWIGMFRGGANIVYNYRDKFSLYDKSTGMGLSHNSVISIAESNDGGLWIGTDGGGLNYLDSSQNTFDRNKPAINSQSSPEDDVILSILEDSNGDLWLGTYGGGLNYHKNAGKKTTRFIRSHDNSNSLSNNSVWVIYEDSNQDIWLGTNGGLNLYNKANGAFIRFQDEDYDSKLRNDNSIRAIFEDSRQNLWLGVMGGVKRIQLKTRKLTSYAFADYDSGTLSNYLVTSIYEDSQGALWLGTYGGGLVRFDEEKGPIRNYNTKDGLPNNVVYGILEDDTNNLWLSTNDGVSKFNTENFSFKNYNRDDGLQSSQFNLGAYYKDKSGRMWFGGINGLNVFYPDSILDSEDVPPVVFTDFKIFNKTVDLSDPDSPLKKHISEADEVELSYKQSVFSFEFAGLNYIYPENNQYAFKLEGFENDWNYVGNQRTATYTNLDPGEYLFRVKSSNNDDKWNEQGAFIKVIITPPWWLTWWAYTLYSLIVMTILWWSRRNILNRERLKTNLKLEHLELTHMQEMDHMKSRFFANISHELRTPLTLILDPLKSMYQEEAHPKMQKQLKTMVRNGKRLLRLINQLLDLSKLEAGHMQLETSRKDMTKWLRRFVPTFSSCAEQHQITLETNFPDQPVYVYFDQDKFEKIITNLLSNALKFTPDGGKVKVEMHVVSQTTSDIGQESSDQLEIVVSDNGVGIPGDRLSHVFDRFFQVDGAHHREQEGTGIGLALTKELVELHKGKIQVESQEQVGSKFIVTLKLGREHLDPTEIVEGDGTELPEKISTFNGLEQIEVKQYEPDHSSFSGYGGKPVVLVVEDNNDLREYIREQLEGNYQVLEAGNGREGIKKALEIIPDLIISDVMMPEKDGMELCDTLKSDTKTSHVPIILLTAKADTEDRIKGLKTGADDYITKPFDTQVLEVRINNLIHSRQLLAERYSNDKTLKLEPKEITVTPLDETLIKNALESIEQNMSNSEFGVENFGKDVGLSRMQLYRKLKALTGQSPNEFIRTIRLKRAAQLIRQRQLTIAEITYDVGFNDLQYFRDCFKKQFGVNPSEYEKEKIV